MEEKKSYLQTRVFEQIGATPEQATIRLRCEGRHGIESEFDTPIFESDSKDNIRIRVWDIDRRPVTYENTNTTRCEEFSDNTKPKEYFITRFNPKNLEEGQPKYLMPKGASVHPFLPPALCDKYESRTHIPTLVITEGYLKAFAASLHGWDIIGLSGITCYADTKTKQIFPDVRKIIDKCKVQNVVVLYDGDCLNPSTKDLEAKRDLNRRPNQFMQAALKTRELLIDYGVDIYFAHVLSDQIQGNPKGLDDLLLALPDKQKEIYDDLHSFSKASTYFYKLNIKSFQQRLQGYFNLTTAQKFYDAWSELIGTREFLYYGSVYQYNPDKDLLERKVPRELKNYMRVGDDYYELIKVPSIRSGQFEIERVGRKKATIVQDFKAYKDPLNLIPKYKTFINYPSHTNYQNVISDCYNTYYPLNYQPEEGTFEHIDALIHHIFGHQYELGMDYMQLLYEKPTQLQYILCLVSQERGTGKTSFLDLLREMFGRNVVNVGNDEIKSEFNSLVSGKLVVGVDETSLDDNRKITERIKMISTAKRIAMQAKGKDSIEIENFTKYVFCSNNETKFIYTNEEEVRFWVVKVPPLKPEEMKPNIIEYITPEIPAFMHFLNTRQMSVPKSEGRFWFAPWRVETEALKRLKEEQKSKPEKLIIDFFQNLFNDFPAEQYLVDVEGIKYFVPELGKYDNMFLRKLLKDKFGFERDKQQQRLQLPYYAVPQDEYIEGKELIQKAFKYKGYPFTIKRDAFFK